MATDDNDNRPLELPIGKHAQIRKSFNTDQSITYFKPRDPRFDAKCAGSNDVRHFVRNYAFIDEVRQDELNKLQAALRKEKDEEKRDKIKRAITRIKNKMVERRNKVEKIELISEMKRASAQPQASSSKPMGQVDQKQKAKRPKKFNNVRKSDIKKQLIVKKYKELKETGKLNKYLERKRKKGINKDGLL